MFRKSLPIGFLLVVLLLVIAGLGVAYGYWNQTMTVGGTVSLGNLDAKFSSISIEANTDLAGSCTKSINGSYSAAFSIAKAFPGFSCKIAWVVENNGSVPWRIGVPHYTFSPAPAPVEVVAGSSSFPKKCTLVKPGDSISGFFTLKILPQAEPGKSYKGSLSFDVQNFMDECSS